MVDVNEEGHGAECPRHQGAVAERRADRPDHSPESPREREHGEQEVDMPDETLSVGDPLPTLAETIITAGHMASVRRARLQPAEGPGENVARRIVEACYSEWPAEQQQRFLEVVRSSSGATAPELIVDGASNAEEQR